VQISKSEARLLGLLAAIVFVGGNFFGYEWLAKKQASLQHTAAELRADQADEKVDLVDAGLWEKRKTWIRMHEPVLGDEGDAKAQTLETVLKGARDNKLDILEQNINDVQHGAAGTQINVTVKVKGSMESLARWLAPFQTPDQFYSIPLFSLKADEDQKSMVCTLQIARYFKDKGGP